MYVEIGTEAAQFLFWENINLNFFAVFKALRQDGDLTSVTRQDKDNKFHVVSDLAVNPPPPLPPQPAP